MLSVSVIAMGLMIPPSTTFAQSVWTGAIDSDMTKAGNWNPATLPTGDAVIDSTTPGAVLNGGGLSVNGTIVVGNDGDAALSVLNGGVLDTGDGTIGANAGSIGNMAVQGAGSTWVGSSAINVGGGGTGLLSILDGGSVQTGTITLGAHAGGAGGVFVLGPGSVLTNLSGPTTVGGAGIGAMSVGNQAVVQSYTGIVGDQRGSVGSVTVDGGSQWTLMEFLVVGRDGEGYLDVKGGGAVESESVFLGERADSRGEATIAGQGSTLESRTSLHVGFSGQGILTIRDGGVVSAAESAIGWLEGSSGEAAVIGNGSQWLTTGDMTIGRLGSASLGISEGGFVENDRGYIGRFDGSVGVVTVHGNGTTWRNGSALEVGVGGSGTLNVVNGGRVESQSGVLGDTAKGIGTVVLDGGGSEWRMPGPLVVGWNGTGNVTVKNGAGLYNGDGVIGLQTGSKGSALVTDFGSRWESSAGLTIGRDGQGSLRIQNGGHVVSGDGHIGRNATGVGIVEVDGINSRWDIQAPSGAFLTVGEAGLGALTISNGGAVADDSATIGSDAGSVGIATVSGAGSRWQNQNYLYVGYNGAGDLSIADGGRVDTTNAAIGVQAISTGQVLVHGAGSVLDVTGRLEVGFLSKDAVLAIRDGGEVHSNFGTLGVLVGSVGAASVFGPNSLWANTDELVVGKSGMGHLEIRNGGQVTSRFGVVGELAGSVGTVVVDGSGSSWANDDNLIVGYGGAGTLNIVNGGSVSNDSGVIGRNAGSTGAVVVAGEGSTWTNRDLLIVGSGGSGVLTVADGAMVSAASNVIVATLAGSTGAINIGAAPGRAAVAAGTLDTPAVNFGAGDGSLNFNHTGTSYLFAPKLTGAGTVNHLSGVTVMTGQSDTFSGPTNVTGGVLVVEGSLGTSTVTVSDHGLLAGTGSIGNLVAETGGVVTPGRSIGTLNVAGDVLFNPNALYMVEIEPGGASDRILAGGAATLNGGTVVVQSASGVYNIGTRYTILTAQGGVNGAFDEAIGTRPTPFLAFDLTYDPTNVFLDVARSNVTFASVGMTPNQIATGGGADSLPSTHPVVQALVQLDVPQAQYAFDQLSGEIHASARTALIEDSRFIRNAVNDRLRAAFGGVGASGTVTTYVDGKPVTVQANTDHLAVWGQGFGSWGHTSGDGNAATLNRKTGGFFVGADAPVFDTWRFGAVAGYSRTDFDVKSRHSSGSSDNYHVGLYGGTAWGDLAFRTGAAYTWHDVTTNRSVIFPGFGDSLRGDYNAGTAQVFGELAYGFSMGPARFEPFANLAYVNLHTDGFTERGGAAALTSPSANTDATFTTLGLRASTTFDMGGSTLTARGMVGWRHAFGDVTPQTAMRFAGAGNPFAIAGVPIARDAAVIEAGLDYAITPGATLGVTYGGQFGSGLSDQSVKANFNVRF